MGDQFETARVKPESSHRPGVTDRDRSRINFTAVSRHVRGWVKCVVHRPHAGVAGVVQHRRNVCRLIDSMLIDYGIHQNATIRSCGSAGKYAIAMRI